MSELRQKNKDLEKALQILTEQHERETMALRFEIRSMALKVVRLTERGEASALMILAAAAEALGR